MITEPLLTSCLSRHANRFQNNCQPWLVERVYNPVEKGSKSLSDLRKKEYNCGRMQWQHKGGRSARLRLVPFASFSLEKVSPRSESDSRIFPTEPDLENMSLIHYSLLMFTENSLNGLVPQEGEKIFFLLMGTLSKVNLS